MLKPLTIVWDFDPVIFSIGDFEIRYYSIMWAAALLVGAWLFTHFCKRENLPTSYADSAFIYIALGTMIGARLGHCLFYEPEYYLSKPWTIITELRNGGLASHGATIGIITAILLWCRKYKMPRVWMLDRLAIIAPLSGAIIRFGNLFNSEIIGHATDVAWGFKFVRLYPANTPIETMQACHPTQLYEAICYIVTFIVLYCLYRYGRTRYHRGIIFGVSMIGIFFTRFLIEFVKVNQVDFEQGILLNMGQWLSLPFIILGIGFIWYGYSHKPFGDIAPNESKPVSGNRQQMPKSTKKFKKR